MKAEYAKLAAKALATIKAKGVAATINRYAPIHVAETGDSIKGLPILTVSTWVVFIAVNKGNKAPFDNATEGASLVATKIRFVKLPALGLTFEPVKGDEFVISGVTYLAEGVTPIAPDGDPILYNVGLVKA
jgi:hypothetical protein